jgi:dihydroorotate dehydrogenase (NAD+) catalytic subunit
MTDLSVDLGFYKLKNPVLAASGTFGYGLEFKPFIDLNKLGGFIVKGLYFHPKSGNPPPRLVETPGGLINAIGLQGIGVKSFAQDILPQLSNLDTAVIINVCGETDEEYASVVKYLNDKPGIAAFELNISCPNVKKEGWCPALDPKATFHLVRKVKKVTLRPIITKLSPNVTNIVKIAQSAEEGGSDALSLVNTFLAMAIDIQTHKPCLSNIFGGLSGPAIKPIALRMVYQVAQAVRIPVIGIGGIMDASDALEYLLAGAKAVEVGTANLIDPETPLHIIQGIMDYCQQNHIQNISEIVGTMRIKKKE